jgi:hypothetical protein
MSRQATTSPSSNPMGLPHRRSEGDTASRTPPPSSRLRVRQCSARPSPARMARESHRPATDPATILRLSYNICSCYDLISPLFAIVNHRRCNPRNREKPPHACQLCQLPPTVNFRASPPPRQDDAGDTEKFGRCYVTPPRNETRAKARSHKPLRVSASPREHLATAAINRPHRSPGQA